MHEYLMLMTRNECMIVLLEIHIELSLTEALQIYCLAIMDHIWHDLLTKLLEMLI